MISRESGVHIYFVQVMYSFHVSKEYITLYINDGKEELFHNIFFTGKLCTLLSRYGL